MTVSPDETRPAVFLDRDGTLMRDVDYCGDPGQVEVFPGTAEALRKLKGAGYQLIIVTNQSGIGRGYFSEDDYRAVEREFLRQLGNDVIDDSYYCADLPETDSSRRKPAPGMILEAQREHHLDLTRSFLIGDKASDIESGRKAGVRTILVQTGYGTHEIELRRRLDRARFRSCRRDHSRNRAMKNSVVIPSRADGEGPLRRFTVTQTSGNDVRQRDPRGSRQRIRVTCLATARSLAVCAARDDTRSFPSIAFASPT